MNKSIITNSIALLGLIVVGWLIYGMIGRVEKKLAFIVDGMEVSERTSLTVGKNSDICFNSVPNDYLTVTAEGDSFRWTVNPEYRDSLQYFKINNDNPNKHTIIDSEDQRIFLNLVTSNGDSLKIDFSGADVWRTWKCFSKQKDVLARHFATFYHFAQGSVSPEEAHADSLRWLNQMQQHAVRSFFESKFKDFLSKEREIVMVILDKNTTIKYLSSDSTITYKRQGYTTTNGGKANCCKVQFFNVSDHCYKESKPEEGYFHIDGVNYVMKASVKLTEWGAGHVMIKNKNGSFSISYPRPIPFVGTADSLLKKSSLSSGHITIKQNNKSFPSKSDLYLPTFSNAINFDLCNLEFIADSGLVKVRDNNFKTTVIRENSFTFRNLKSSLVPTIAKIDLKSGNDTLKCRVGFIGKHFILSYLYLPLAVFLVLLCLVWNPWSPLRVEDAAGKGFYNPYQLSNYRMYLSILLSVCLCFCFCKSLIALKLSYTFPYFEKMTGIIPASTSLMMLLFFSICMLLNAKMAKRNSIGNNINLFFCLFLLLGLYYAFFYVMDSNISYGVLDSYFGEEKSTWRVWKWMDLVGINDTHRSVVFTLLLMEGVVLVAWFLWTSESEYVGAVVAWIKKSPIYIWIVGKVDWEKNNRTYGAVLFAILTACAAIMMARELSLESLSGLLHSKFLYGVAGASLLILVVPFMRKAMWETLKALFPWHMLILYALAAMGVLGGNFATAFITLMVILGLTKALSDVAKVVDETKKEGKVVKRSVVFLEMMFITVVYILFAMMGDNGYLTNYIGIFTCAICFYLIVKRPEENRNRNRKETDVLERRNETITISVVMLALVLFSIFLPEICNQLVNPEKVDYSRMTRRITLFADFSKLQENGYRYNESDAEFMIIMNHYMQHDDGHDPLSNDMHFMHPSVSSGQSPVVLNDLSLPIAFLGTYGIKVTTFVYLLLLFLLSWLVMRYSFGYSDNDPKMDRSMQWRLLALFMWVGTCFYIYLSYLGRLPFTGRLNPGYGVDAVGEALETALLLAFMGTVAYKKKFE